MSAAPVPLAPGLVHVPGYLDQAGQAALLDAIHAVLKAAPPFTPRMPRTGKPFSVRMSNCGPLGWVSDERGYRYQPTHPETGAPWPPMPDAVLSAWGTSAAMRDRLKPVSSTSTTKKPAWACIRTGTRPI